MLKDKIDKKQPIVRSVWFTAWKYEQYDALWRAFILRVLDALYPRVDGPEPREQRARKTIDELDDESQKELVRKLNRLEESVYRPVDWQELGRWTVDWWGLAKGSAKTFARLAAAFMPGAGFLEQALKIINSGSDEEAENAVKAFQRQVKTYHLNQLQYMEQFEEIFGEVIKLAKIDRLVVFVDDLDRCLPEKAIQILEAIKLFLEVEGTVFVLGMDKEIVERGIEARYHDWFKPVQASGEDAEGEQRPELPIRGDAYLQKMVQIPFYLPPLGLGDIERYMGNLEEDLTEDDRLSEVTRSVLARGLYPNPRQVKRALNTFRLLNGLVKAREDRYQDGDQKTGLEPGKISPPLLAKTMLIQQQWPDLYRNWRSYPILVPMLEQEYAKRPLTLEEAVLGDRVRSREIVQARTDKTDVKADEKTLPKTIEPNNLLYPYFKYRRKYQRLEQMLTYPPAGEIGEEQERTHFDGLKTADIEAYLMLVSSASESQSEEEMQVSESLLDDLLSGDPVKVRTAIEKLNQGDETAQEAQIRPYRNSLLEVMGDSKFPPPMRVSAGNALAELGDPSFDPSLYFLPNDPLVGFRLVPAGEFLMGSEPNDDPAADDEKPQHKLSLPDYYIARFPVTVAQFGAFCKHNGFKPSNDNSLKGIANHPVVLVTWHEAIKYCGWLTSKLKELAPGALDRSFIEPKSRDLEYKEKEWREFWEGFLRENLIVTLPSEAEWEKAARGVEGFIYPWGKEFDANKANIDETGIGTTSSVGCFPGGISPFGALDMSGNVWEWTRSHFKPYEYDPHDGREDLEAGDNTPRVRRGGSFGSLRWDARCASRYWVNPNNWSWFFGFRLAVRSPLPPKL